MKTASVRRRGALDGMRAGAPLLMPNLALRLMALAAVAALGCFGTMTALGLPAATEGQRPRTTGRLTVESIELVAKTPLAGPPTGLAVGRTRVGVSLALEGVVILRRDDARIARRIGIDGASTSIHTDGRRFWVADLLHDRVLELDEVGSVLDEFRVGRLPGGIALTRSDVWVLGLEEPSITLADRWSRLPTVHMTFGAGELWPGAIASGTHGIWLATGHKTAVTLMDPDRYVARGTVELRGVDRLSATASGAWAARQGSGPELTRIDGSTLALHPVDLPGAADVTAIDAGPVLAVAVRGALLGLDPQTGELRARGEIDPDLELTHIAVDGDRVWAVDATHNQLLRFRIAHRGSSGREALGEPQTEP